VGSRVRHASKVRDLRFISSLTDNHVIDERPTSRTTEAPTRNTETLSLRTDSRLGKLVRVLAEHPTLVISGTKLAEEVGSNRSDVWRLVQQLRSLGVKIAGHPATGYQLTQVPDLPLPEVVEPALQGTIFSGKVHHYFRVGSTNMEAMAAAAAGAAEGSVFLAEEQTAGRGRGGHTWTSPPSTGIYCSVILRPTFGPADALMLSLIAGLATASAVKQVAGLSPDLRWPNDLLLDEKKFCGILTEMNAEVTRVRYAVLGVGINVNQQEFPQELAPIATSLRIVSGQENSRVALTIALLQSLDREYKALLSGVNRAEIFGRLESVSSYVRGKRVHIDEDGGYKGVTAGLDERGFLRVETATGIRTVISGGVRSSVIGS
jgi:BirA family biotin operon repressor/biotin-[acetyl-CoA-carboxylase] ligase